MNRRRLALAAVVLVLLIAALTWRGRERQPAVAARGPLPCVQHGYPCTWNEVDPEVVERTKRLGEIAMLSLIDTPDLKLLAEFLAGVESMAEVVLDGTALRFRLEGGRPAWVVLPDELNHHFPANTHAPTPSAASPRTPTGGRVGLLERLGPRPLHAATFQNGPPQTIAGRPGEGKRALVLAPFEYELKHSGDFVDGIRLIRDYREENDGSVTWHADLHVLADNPVRPAGAGPSGEVVFDDFLGWDDADLSLIILLTHGGKVACNRPIPRGGEVMDQSTLYEGPRCPIIVAGRAKQTDYGDRLGVELFYWGNPVMSYVPRDAPETRFDAPDERGWQERSATHPGLTGPERVWCWERQENGENAVTAGGKPCFVPVWVHDRPMIALWTPFFETEYPNGLEGTVVFLAACYSGSGEVLPRILAPQSARGVTVLGFDSVAMEDDAAFVINETIRLVDLGYHSDRLVERLGQLDRSGLLTGRTLDPTDAPPATSPTAIVEVSPAAVHGRDVVALKTQAGVELEAGSVVDVVGVAGDGAPDSLDVRATLLGVSDPAMLPQVRLSVAVVAEGSGEPFRPTWTESGPEAAYHHRFPVPLGRDARDGEVVDLEIEAVLPGGGTSRWRYRDIGLAVPPLCGFVADVSGGRYPGTHSGPARVLGNAMVLTDYESGWSANVVLPLADGGRDGGGGAWRPGRIRTGEYPTDMEMVVARVPVENDTAVFMASSGGTGAYAQASAAIRIERVDGEPSAGGPGDDALLVGEVEGHLAWRESDDRPSFADVRIRFRAVPFGVGPGSSYQRCRDAWRR